MCLNTHVRKNLVSCCVCVCVCLSPGQGRSVWVMLRTAVVQMKEATCSLPCLNFLLTSIIYTFSQTYKQPPIRPTLTHSTPVLYTHTCCTYTYLLCLLILGRYTCWCSLCLYEMDKERKSWGWWMQWDTLLEAAFKSFCNVCFIVLFAEIKPRTSEIPDMIL